MILTLLLIAAITAGLVPLIVRDLRRAIARRRLRQFIVRFEVDVRQFTEQMRRVGLTTAITADRLRALGEALRQADPR